MPASGIRYVNASGSDAGNLCTAPSLPCRSIQHAVDQAQPGEEVRIAGGTYSGVGVRNGISQTVYISKSLAIRGGYSAANWAVPDTAANPTILDAQRQGRVLYATGDIHITLEGLRITGGDATGLGGYTQAGWTAAWDAGGGVYVRFAAGEIRDCRVYSNTAGSGYSVGGGLSLWQTSLSLRDSVVSENASGHFGGGLFLREVTGSIRGDTVISNTSEYGGGLFAQSPDVHITRNVIQGNVATNNGGGIAMMWTTGTLESNSIVTNTANLRGGGLDLDRSPITMVGNTIVGNVANAVLGGGMRIIQSDALLVNNVVAANVCNGTGAGIHVMNSSPRLLHTTFADNRGGDGSAAHVASQSGAFSRAVFTNTILSGHTVGITVTQGNTVTLASTLWHANASDWAGAGALGHTQDYAGPPAFVNPAGGDYHIGAASSAIDQGVDAGVTTDLDGHVRPWGLAPDLGADEYGSAAPAAYSIHLPIIFRRRQ